MKKLKKFIPIVLTSCLLFQNNLVTVMASNNIIENDIINAYNLYSPIISINNIQTFDGSNEYDISDKKDLVKDLKEGSINIRFKTNSFTNSDGGLMSLFSVSNNTVDNTYASFYVKPSSNTIGIESKSDNNMLINASVSAPNESPINNTQWHTVTFSVDNSEGKYYIYVDGISCGTGDLTNKTGLFDLLSDINKVRIGDLSRQRGNLWKFNGNVDLLQVYDRPLDENEVKNLHATTIREKTELPADQIKTEPESLFYENYDNSVSYRIPSLLTTKDGVVIAGIDKRQSGPQDADNIDISIRRSTDSGKTWDDAQIILKLDDDDPDKYKSGVADPEKKNRTSFFIDSSMLEDKETGEIHLLVDMFPESMGLMESYEPVLADGSGYTEVNGKKYLELRDYYSVNTGENSNKVHTDNIYTLREDGKVFLEKDSTSTATEYSVPDFSTGELLKNGNSAGNIFIYTGKNAGELKIKRTSYLWKITSTDNGATWSKPVDITGQVKSEWMRFMGTGPGVGIQIENGDKKGRLVYPVYFTNSNIGGSQCSAVIYSDDHGKTWTLGESPIVLKGLAPETMNSSYEIITESQVVEVGNNGRIKILMRNRSGKVLTATSDDGGATWTDLKKDEAIYDSYCQLSVIKYGQQLEYDGKMQDAYILSNPSLSGRNDGTVYIGFYDEEKNEFIWPYKKLVHAGRYQYSCLTTLPNNNIGVFYEGDVPNMRFTQFNVDWVKAPVPGPKKPVITKVQAEKIQGKDDIIFKLDFDQYIFKTGTPILKILVDGKEEKAYYEKGGSTKQLTFRYNLENKDAKKITVINISSDNTSEIGNLANLTPEDCNYDINLEDIKPLVGTGDVDKDDEVTSNDAATVLKSVLDNDVNINENADIDGNGIIDSNDAVTILNKALGID